MNSLSHSHRAWLLAAFILIAALPLFLLYLGWGFIDPDEGRYALIPREMLMSGDFITPTQNHLKFFDKPPLLYWLIAGSYAIFGYHEWAARLIPALCGLAGVLLCYGLGRRMFGARAGIIAAMVLGTTLMWMITARIVMTDMLVSFLIFAALALWWLGHSEAENNRRRTTWFLGFWSVLALAVLAKGPVAVVLAGGAISLYALSCRQWRALREMRWLAGVPLFLLIAAPWFILVAERNPEFNHFFWYDQHIGRFVGGTSSNAHVEGPLYYFKLLPLLFFPWSLFFPAALIRGWQALHKSRNDKYDAAIFLLCGAAFITLFFSISSGKLPTYILPIVPLASLLLAACFDNLLARRWEWNGALSFGVALLSILLLAGGVAVLVKAPARLQTLEVAPIAAQVAGAVLVAWAIGLAILSWRYHLKGAIGATAGGFACFFVSALVIAKDVVPRLSIAPLVEHIRPGLRSGARLVSIKYTPSVGFYAGQRVQIIDPPAELALGVSQISNAEKKLWIAGKKDKIRVLQREMKSSTPAYCIIRQSRKKESETQSLLRAIGGVVKIARNERFVVIGNQAAAAITPPQPGL